MVSNKTIERLIIYKFILQKEIGNGTFIFSHKLAELTNFSPSQVRRDLMAVGYTGNQKNGYNIKELIECIKKFLDQPVPLNIVLVGVGNLGKALLRYYSALRPDYSIVACFDTDESKIGNFIHYSKCYTLADMPDVIKEKEARCGIITVPVDAAQKTADLLIDAGVTGIINFAPLRIKVPDTIYIEHIDLSAIVEKVAYFSR